MWSSTATYCNHPATLEFACKHDISPARNHVMSLRCTHIHSMHVPLSQSGSPSQSHCQQINTEACSRTRHEARTVMPPPICASGLAAVREMSAEPATPSQACAYGLTRALCIQNRKSSSGGLFYKVFGQWDPLGVQLIGYGLIEQHCNVRS